MFLKTSSRSVVLMVAMSFCSLSVLLGLGRLRRLGRGSVGSVGFGGSVGSPAVRRLAPRRRCGRGASAASPAASARGSASPSSDLAAFDALVDVGLQAVGEVAGEGLEQAGALTSGRLEAAGEPGEQHLAGRHVGEGLDVAAASARRVPSMPPFTTRFGLVLAKSRSALAAVTASPPSAHERDRDRALEQLDELGEPGVARRPGGPACS